MQTTGRIRRPHERHVPVVNKLEGMSEEFGACWRLCALWHAITNGASKYGHHISLSRLDDSIS